MTMLSNSSLSSIRSSVLAAPVVDGRWPIGQAAQFLRCSQAIGLKVLVEEEGWGWVRRDDVLTAARLGAVRTPLYRLVGVVRPGPAPRRPLLLTCRITPQEQASTVASFSPSPVFAPAAAAPSPTVELGVI